MSLELEDAIVAVRTGQQHSVMVKCTAHDDGNASLHVSPGTSGQPVTLLCHAGCDTADVIAEAGLDWSEVCAPLEAKVVPLRIQPIIYSYVDEQGEELFQALRSVGPDGKKTFRQRHLGHTGNWVWNLNGVRRVIYRLPQVIEAIRDGRVVWLVEGEKDVHSLEELGEVATTNPMGAGKWLPEYTEALRGGTIHVIADRDKPGRAHAREVAELLEAADCTVRRFEPGREGAKDVTDHLRAGGSLSDLLSVSQDAEESAQPVDGTDILDYVQWDFAAEQFVIPGTLAAEERVLVTGLEGHGKSTLFRQIAVMCAAGIHPFTLEEMEPVRTLVIDAENGPRQMHRSWSDLVGRAAHHGHKIQPGMLNLMMEYLNQPDLTSLDGRQWLMERVIAYRPGLILIGPVQNLTARDVKDDDVVRRFKRTVDETREVCGSAIFMEHHAPHRAPGDKKRSLRPYGSSLFLKWPDYGYGMNPTDEEGVYDWERTRYPRERSRIWPERLRWGAPNSVEWPWMDAGPNLAGSQNVRSA